MTTVDTCTCVAMLLNYSGFALYAGLNANLHLPCRTQPQSMFLTCYASIMVNTAESNQFQKTNLYNCLVIVVSKCLHRLH